MKRETIVICILAMLAMSGIAVAAEGDLGITFDTTWVSKYLWRGFDVLDDKAAIQPSLNIDLGNGLSAGVWASYGGAGGTMDNNEYDYSLTYAGSTCEDTAGQIDYAATWIYYDMINLSSGNDFQEMNLSLSMPNICPIGIVPSYTIVKVWAAQSDSEASEMSNWIHVVGLDYALAVDGFIDNNPQQVIDLSWDMTYNDGVGEDVDHDWSHMTFGASTAIALPGDVGTVRPGIFYQVSMDDSVNDEDELWSGISYSLSF